MTTCKDCRAIGSYSVKHCDKHAAMIEEHPESVKLISQLRTGLQETLDDLAASKAAVEKQSGKIGLMIIDAEALEAQSRRERDANRVEVEQWVVDRDSWIKRYEAVRDELVASMVDVKRLKVYEDWDQNYIRCEACQRYTLPCDMEDGADCCCKSCARFDQLQAEVERLTNWVNNKQAGMYIDCPHCGHKCKPDDGVSATMSEALNRHLGECHTLAASKAEVERLKFAAKRSDDFHAIKVAELQTLNDYLQKKMNTKHWDAVKATNDRLTREVERLKKRLDISDAKAATTDKLKTAVEWQSLIRDNDYALYPNAGVELVEMILAQGKLEGMEATMEKYGLNVIAETCKEIAEGGGG